MKHEFIGGGDPIRLHCYCAACLAVGHPVVDPAPYDAKNAPQPFGPDSDLAIRMAFRDAVSGASVGAVSVPDDPSLPPIEIA